MNRKNTTLILIFLIVIHASSNGSSPAQIQNPVEIKVGGLFPLTGALSLGGRERAAAFQMAVNLINNDSDLLPNHRIVPIIKDTRTNPETGVQVAQEIIDEGGVALIGASSSSVSLAIADGPSKNSKIPQISYSSTSPILSDKNGYPYFLRVVPSDILQTRAIIELVQSFGWDFISILRNSNIYSQGVSSEVGSSGQISDVDLGVNSLASQAEALDIEVIQNRAIKFGDNIRSHLQQIRLLGSNVILLNVYLDDAIEIFELAEELDMTSANGYVWIGTDSATQTEVLEASNSTFSAMQGFIGLKPLQPDIPAFDQFLDLWEDCAGESEQEYTGCGDRSPNIYAPFAYDALYFLASTIHEIIELKQDYSDGDILMDRLLGFSMDGITGRITLDKNGDRLSGYDVVNVQNDEFVNVGTWELFVGFQQTSTIYWQGNDQGPTEPPRARLASSWILLLSVIILPTIIYLIRKIRELVERRLSQ